jgi:hypothetical protein
MIKCGSGDKKIVKPLSPLVGYNCMFTELFKTITEEGISTPAVNETIVLSIILNKGDYFYDFSCYGENTSDIHTPTAIIRGWLNFGLSGVLAVDNTTRTQSKIATAQRIGKTASYFMMRGNSGVFSITTNGTILSVTFESSYAYTDINLYCKVLNVFKITNYSNIII